MSTYLYIYKTDIFQSRQGKVGDWECACGMFEESKWWVNERFVEVPKYLKISYKPFCLDFPPFFVLQGPLSSVCELRNAVAGTLTDGQESAGLDRHPSTQASKQREDYEGGKIYKQNYARIFSNNTNKFTLHMMIFWWWCSSNKLWCVLEFYKCSIALVVVASVHREETA